MPTNKEDAARLKPVKLDGVTIAIPRNLSKEEEERVIEEARIHITTDPQFLARKQRAEEDAAKMQAKLAAHQERRLQEYLAKQNAANPPTGGDNPAE